MTILTYSVAFIIGVILCGVIYYTITNYLYYKKSHSENINTISKLSKTLNDVSITHNKTLINISKYNLINHDDGVIHIHIVDEHITDKSYLAIKKEYLHFVDEYLKGLKKKEDSTTQEQPSKIVKKDKNVMLNHILDKMSKSGIDSLAPRELSFLKKYK